MSDTSWRVLLTSIVTFLGGTACAAIKMPFWGGFLIGVVLGLFILWLWRDIP